MNLFLVLWLAACGGPTTPDATTPPEGEAAAKKRGKKAAGEEGEQEGEPGKGKKKARAKPPGEAVEVAGTLTFGEGDAATLVPCAGGAPIELTAGVGSPAKARTDLGAEVTTAYAEVRGQREGEGPIIVRSIDLAIVDGPGCAEPFTDTLRAFGNEPGWNLTINDAAVTLNRMDQGELTLTDLTKVSTDRMIHTYSANTASGPVKLVVQRKRCMDTMATAYYPWTATVEVQGATLSGCARGVLPGQEVPKAVAAPEGAGAEE
jgi:uncharacterized membrane protein